MSRVYDLDCDHAFVWVLLVYGWSTQDTNEVSRGVSCSTDNQVSVVDDLVDVAFLLELVCRLHSAVLN